MTGIAYIILIAAIGTFYIIYEIIKLNKIKKEPQTLSMLQEVQEFFKELELKKQEYFTKDIQENLVGKYKEIFNFFSKYPYSRLKHQQVLEFKKIYSNMDSLSKGWNEEYIERELVSHESLFDNIDGKSLDAQQRRAVIVDEINNLVLAGAGSGKTLTISAKVKYLVDTKNIRPAEILLISFTTKASKEMQERIAGRLGIDIESKTFHKLGLDIITRYRGKRPDVAEELYLRSIIDEYFIKNIFDQCVQQNAEHITGGNPVW